MSRRSAPVPAIANAALRALPESAVLRLIRIRDRGADVDIPSPVDVAAAPTRLLVAPANYAGQGRAWAASAERLGGVRAVNLEVVARGGYSFPADFRVSDHVYAWSRRWATAQETAIAERFTHVLIEAERSILGRACGFDVRREGEWLDGRGVSRAYVSHGSDLRLPSRHAEFDRWSLFRDIDWELLPALEAAARRNAAFLEEQGRPVFVSTPELLLDAPGASWLPVVVEPARWAASRAPLSGGRPTVFHAPTNARSKGGLLIEPALEKLDAEGLVSYRPAERIAAELMPAAVGRSDIVLDQFRVGSYGVSACEAMAAGRVVVGHVSAQVREVAEAAAGMPLPIVEADPGTFEDVVRELVADPDRSRALAATGPDFVARVHDGTYSARVLAPFLGARTADQRAV